MHMREVSSHISQFMPQNIIRDDAFRIYGMFRLKECDNTLKVNNIHLYFYMYDTLQVY